MSGWILRAAIFFCGLAMLSAAALVFVKVEVAQREVLLTLLWMTLAAFAIFAVLLTVGIWRKSRKAKLTQNNENPARTTGH